MRYLRKLYLVIIFSFSLFIIFFGYLSPANAQTPCPPTDRNQGLVSSVGFSGAIGNQLGQCVIDPKAAYVNFKIPNYDELKSVFFTQNRTVASQTLNTTSNPGCPDGNTITLKNLSFAAKTVMQVQCNFTHIFDSDPTNGPLVTAGVQQTVVIFVDNHLYINTNLNYGGGAYGVVLVVKGDIYIAPAVTQINAILVNQGSIFTTNNAGNYFQLAPNSLPLVVNGSLINLAQTAGNRIYFNRSLTDNNVPAEKVNYQPKFLVLLRGLLTQSFTIQREIGADEIPSSGLFPAAVTIPSPAATVNQGSSFKNPYCLYGVYDLFNSLNIASETTGTCPNL